LCKEKVIKSAFPKIAYHPGKHVPPSLACCSIIVHTFLKKTPTRLMMHNNEQEKLKREKKKLRIKSKERGNEKLKNMQLYNSYSFIKNYITFRKI
jgi:hypothetical protein